MLDEQSEGPDIRALVRRLHEMVEERRRSGEYPPDLEQSLAGHYQQILAGQGLGADRLEQLLRNLDLASDLGRYRIQNVSSVPLGSIVHKMISKVTARQTDGILLQVAELAVAINAVVVELAESQQPGGARLSDITARIDDILDRLAEDDHKANEADAYIRGLEARLARLEQLLGPSQAPNQ
jgi:hypothetical protein